MRLEITVCNVEAPNFLQEVMIEMKNNRKIGAESVCRVMKRLKLSLIPLFPKNVFFILMPHLSLALFSRRVDKSQGFKDLTSCFLRVVSAT